MEQALQNNPLSTPPTAPTSMSAAPVSAPTFADGGTTFTPEIPQSGKPSSGGLSFKDFDWIAISFMFLGSLALFKTIQYYSYKLKADKLVNYDLQNQIDELRQDQSSIVSALQGQG
jgi:hypothetical protein